LGINPDAVLSPADARHLVRRAGFGADSRTVNRILKAYFTRGRAADLLLRFKPARYKPKVGSDVQDTHNDWVKYMVSARYPLQEKLVLFWHDHFASGVDKVKDASLMATQNRLFRQNCKGDFKALVKAVNRDAAMMVYLDTVQNRKRQPNENYSRELQELFTLGVEDFAGSPNYTQNDIVQIARAFSGWTVDKSTGAVTFNASQHDTTAAFPSRGPKVIYQTTGGFGPAGRDFTQPGGEGAAEIDQVIDIIFDHTDTDGKKTAARFITGKLLTYFAVPGAKRPIDPDWLPAIDDIVSASGFETSWNIAALLRAMFTHDVFYRTAAAVPFSSDTEKAVKWPIDYVVSTLRLLGMRLKDSDQHIDFHTEKDTRAIVYLSSMGQVVFLPPSVFGWDWDTAWLSSATLQARYTFAVDVTSARGKGRTAFRPEKLVKTSLTDAAAIVDTATGVLGITDQLTASERQTLIDYLTDGVAGAAVDLRDDSVRNTKLNGLFALVIQSPAYQLQ
jgi:uncharacterized protein (DUF1800 family)